MNKTKAPLQNVEEIFARAEAARDQGCLEDAARLFGRSASNWAAYGKVIQAADAYFELGAILLQQGRGGLLPDLADRLLELLKCRPLPAGSLLKLQIFALLMKRGATEQGAFFSLVHEQRRHRTAWKEHELANLESLAAREAPGEPSFTSNWEPSSNERFLERQFEIATRRESIVLAERLQRVARAFDCPICCFIGDDRMTVWIPATEVGWEFAWMLESKDVALMEEYPVG